jgi:ADP-ribosylglycohydrolase
MRMAPLAWHPEKDEAAFFYLIREASSVTHRHPRSVMACHFYLLLLRNLFHFEPAQAWEEVRTNWPTQIEILWPEAAPELAAFGRILRPDFASLSEDEIQSGGYVMHSLEASVWCLLNSNSYAEAVLKAVNLGGDTDTTGAICGALAGTVYGYSGIPEEWRRMLARTTEIEELSSRFHQKFAGYEVV